MTYSFSVSALTKEEAKIAVSKEFTALTEKDPTHRHNLPVVNSILETIDLTDKQDHERIMVYCNGYVVKEINEAHEPKRVKLISNSFSVSLAAV